MSLLLGAKAEVVFGVLLVVRHRPLRLACVLAFLMVALPPTQNLGRTPRSYQASTVFFIAGTLAAVAGSRLLAPGAALAASRQVASRCWVTSYGRLAGALLVVLPVVTVAVFSLNIPEYGHVRLSSVASVYAAAVASGVMLMAPAIGASAAAMVGFVAVWVGSISPQSIHESLNSWPLLQGAISVLWKSLPFEWRAVRLLETCSWMDALFLVGWTAVGVALAGWLTVPVRPSGGLFRGGA